jgi:DNA topoisomerase-1
LKFKAIRMVKKLIIVESPAKMKTLKKFLPKDFAFESSVGHIRDLPQKGLGIDVDNDFEPEYVTLPDKKEVIDRLKKAAKQADMVYLSPDPDREGEAIAWHIASILPKGTKTQRVTFNEFTKDAVLEAVKHPRDIDLPLVNAQQARRLLDRIVGYKISPILMRRVQGSRDGGLSAGRVQSVALKMVVDREKEIEAFIPVEYWNLGVMLKLSPKDKPFRAHLYSVDGKKIEKEAAKNSMAIGNETDAKKVADRLKKASYQVISVEKKEKKRNPVAPFITSTLQQEASRHFGFSAARTMNIAQGLYEGIDLGHEGTEGLITYMRTDSVRLSPEAIENARKFIVQTYGKEFLPPEGRQFSAKKNAQDAHEAIRPTAISRTPEAMRPFLTDDQFKLYSLIWKRTVASQMNPAIYDTVSCDIEGKEGIVVRATGSTLKFSGFLAVYEERMDKGSLEESSKEEEKMLPPLEEKASLFLSEVISEQAFTRPPPRFTEASLVKELEKSGIGRPSTYAAIMNKIQSRDYTTKEKGTLKPTELGKIIAQMLEDNFKMIMDIGFTASMETELEHVGENTKDWKVLLREFWKDFFPLVEAAEKDAFVPKVTTDKVCPECGKPLQKIWAKNKYFYGCSDYPTCRYTAALEALDFSKEDYDPNFDWDQKCTKCGKEMKLRFGKFGAFLGCIGYPECRTIVNIPKVGEAAPEESVPCPAIGCDGQIQPRRSRFGKVFFSCSNYPDCDVIVNAIDELETKYPDHPKTAYVSKKAPKEKKGAAKGKKTAAKEKKAKPASSRKQKEYTPSVELAAIVGSGPISRPDVVKKMWDYIKSEGCQDSKNKRMICPDEKLSKVFGSKEPIDMMKLAKVLSPHLS